MDVNCKFHTHMSFLFGMDQVVVDDQGEWAVCGRSAGVVDMATAKRQTLVVEIMALTGGHLLLPRVQLMKYIPAPKAVVVVSEDNTATVNSDHPAGAAIKDNNQGTSVGTKAQGYL